MHTHSCGKGKQREGEIAAEPTQHTPDTGKRQETDETLSREDATAGWLAGSVTGPREGHPGPDGQGGACGVTREEPANPGGSHGKGH